MTKQNFVVYDQVCNICGCKINKLSRKSTCMCDDCHLLHSKKLCFENRIKQTWKAKRRCKCCDKVIYEAHSKGLCDFCETEYTAMMQEREFIDMTKSERFKEILKVMKKLDELQVDGTNLQNVRI